MSIDEEKATEGERLDAAIALCKADRRDWNGISALSRILYINIVRRGLGLGELYHSPCRWA